MTRYADLIFDRNQEKKDEHLMWKERLRKLGVSVLVSLSSSPLAP
jgi:hypothetical protein